MLDDNQTLPKSYTIFGRVTKGQDVVRAINVGDVMRSVIVESK
jgi:cyclophilin family peptidyl-prolyl cis-trans isomerase